MCQYFLNNSIEGLTGDQGPVRATPIDIAHQISDNLSSLNNHCACPLSTTWALSTYPKHSVIITGTTVHMLNS